MISLDNLCPGCMRELDKKIRTKSDSSGCVCPHCGFDWKKYNPNPRCLAINTILAGKYLVGRVLGEGGFGITYIGFDLNMQVPVAIKEYFPVEMVGRDTTAMTGDRVLSLSGDKGKTYQAGLEKYVMEARNVSQFANMSGVVSVKDFFYENDTAYIVMEFIDGISLKEYMKKKGAPLSEEETLALMRPVLEALQKVHESGIIHRDISPDNIMLTFQEKNNPESPVESVKLIDFGAARMVSANDQRSLTIILKHGYAPEEQYRTHGEQGAWTDVYAICATMYKMLTGATPSTSMDRLFADDLKAPKELVPNVSAGTSETLMKGLAVKKEDRILSIAELIQALYEGGKIHAASEKKKWMMGLITGGSVLIAAAVFAGVYFGVIRNVQADRDALASGAMESENAGLEETSGENSSDAASESDMAEDGEMLVVEDKQEAEQEWLVSYDPARSIITGNPYGNTYTLLCLPDGTIAKRGSGQNGNWPIYDTYEDAAFLFDLGDGGIHGMLKKDGKIEFLTGYLNDESYTSCVSAAEDWDNIVDVRVFDDILVGLKADGTLECSAVVWWAEEEKTAILEELHSLTDVRMMVTDGDSADYSISAVFLKENGALELVTGLRDSAAEEIQEKLNAAGDWSDVERLVWNNRWLFGFTAAGEVKSVYASYSEPYDYDETLQIVTETIYYHDELGVRQDGTLFIKGDLGAGALIEDPAAEELLTKEQTLEEELVTSIRGLYGSADSSDPIVKSGEALIAEMEEWAGQSSDEMDFDEELLNKMLLWMQQAATSGENSEDDMMQILDLASTWMMITLEAEPVQEYVSEYEEETMENTLIAKMRSWTNLVAVTTVGEDYAVGITKDGQILEAVRNTGNSEYEDFKNLEWVDALFGGKALIAKTKDGNVLTYGAFPENETIDFMNENLAAVKQVTIEHIMDYSGSPEGLFSAVVLEDGSASYTIEGRSTKTFTGVDQIALIPEIAAVCLMQDGTLQCTFEPEYEGDTSAKEDFNELTKAVEDMTDVAQIAGSMYDGIHGFMIRKSDGTLWMWEYEEFVNVTEYDSVGGEPIEFLAYTDNFVDGELGFLGLKADGTVESYSQMGYGTYYSEDIIYLFGVVENWTDIKQLSMGCAHAVGLREDGTAEVTGLNYAGQCDVSEWKDIVYIDTADNLTLGIDKDGNLLKAGSFCQ